MNRPTASTILRATAAIVLVALFIWTARHYLNPYAAPFAEWVRARGAWGPVAFVAMYIVVDLLVIPGAILTLIAGALFGFVHGVIYAFVGALLGSVASFLVARYAVKPIVERRLRDNERFKFIDRAAKSGGVRLVALLRLSPVMPYNVLNYALGITGLTTTEYTIGTLAILPGTAMYVYYGTVAGTLTGLSNSVPHGTGYYTLMAVGVVATIVAAIFMARLARRELTPLEQSN
ncbi:MAG: TVP38/TMEM64 family protein [Gemmatimonadales bacterium]